MPLPPATEPGRPRRRLFVGGPPWRTHVLRRATTDEVRSQPGGTFLQSPSVAGTSKPAGRAAAAQRHRSRRMSTLHHSNSDSHSNRLPLRTGQHPSLFARAGRISSIPLLDFSAALSQGLRDVRGGSAIQVLWVATSWPVDACPDCAHSLRSSRRVPRRSGCASPIRRRCGSAQPAHCFGRLAVTVDMPIISVESRSSTQCSPTVAQSTTPTSANPCGDVNEDVENRSRYRHGRATIRAGP